MHRLTEESAGVRMPAHVSDSPSPKIEARVDDPGWPLLNSLVLDGIADCKHRDWLA
ncbi:uncharacterized protein PGTG_22268 [Puccinia graminis f. sp. tritici CRL 75-36-700-3]|uniref:Uncharacterized protein n=1 Tax=Puccinia graminis f. sp. tritici (strain CRL 75-36-700-3 / race SCCL) TaxID=418459 RepID=H6QU43_PUCGT|nr:uncharacterized protein PGTG_22268 [Puccinia graminis f. sp. tritici CRL 75-36-700-3]EHS64455.1 hypothetical protein PGTG_22268 [Puccinia graminis f. sp. tritici CRL 75-36-700-3]